MSQRNLQIIVIALSVALFALLYFGGRTTANNRSDVEKTRALIAEGSTDTEKMIMSAKADLTEENLAPIVAIEAQLPLQLTDSLRAESFKALSREWNILNKFSIGGVYALKVAEIENTETAWSIAGTTFGFALQKEKDADTRKFCVEESVKAFEKAIEINPNETQHKINLALTYVETEQPMQGITMLRDLSQKEPENTSVLMALAQLSIRSGQYDKAIERYETVVKLEPNNVKAHYGLAQMYQSLGKNQEAIASYNKCLSLSEDEKLKSDIEQIIKKIK
ncbi:MAG: tetratricopeptide repeat protein [Saprospiraceae bacterium]|nr:tetratricopeptide repeat protein [Saprospiraceae bacterium]